MNLTKYTVALTQGDKEKGDALAPARAKEQQAALGIRIATLDLEVQKKENAVATLTQAYPLDLDGIVDAIDELDLDRRTLATLKDIEGKLFS